MNEYKKNQKKKKKVALLVASLAAFFLIAGTFAWTSYTIWKKNHMQSKGFQTGEVSIVESFPNPEITPGGEIKKDILINNASDNDIFVRVSFEEMLQKLKTTAEPKGYASLADAGFPVTINAKEYTTSGSNWVDKTADLRVDGKVPAKLAEGDIGYKLYVDGSSAALVYVKKTPKASYPNGFEFDGQKKPIPLFGDTSFTKDDAQVAQKITGIPTRPADNTYNYSTTAPAGAAIQYYGYGVSLDTIGENNWAGSSVQLTDKKLVASKPVDPKKSAIDADMAFAMGSVGMDAADIGASDWFYNKDDGYFYYTKKLLATTTTTSSILQSIKIPDNETYGISSYDLHVEMQAIPSYLSAMAAAVNDDQSGAIGDTTTNGGGWGLQTTDKIYTYFASIADAEE